MADLWSDNTPARFWQCRPFTGEQAWQSAFQKALPTLGLRSDPPDVEHMLSLVLGENQFGPDQWSLSRTKRLYYELKPFLPRFFTRLLRKLYGQPSQEKFPLSWPVETRYASFLWEMMRQVMIETGQASIAYTAFWPTKQPFAFVLTHDVETGAGQAFVRQVADFEERLGFRSSFNFVAERYPLDKALIQELRERGFEIGIHGLKHDGKLFNSHAAFSRRAKRINHYLEEMEAVGFRAPLTHRQPYWMQELDIEYDLSFFDTDPYEPIAGGAMSLWPFFIGKFVELPYTLVQDYTLVSILGEKTPRIWLEKLAVIEQYHGLALLNSHPDYLRDETTWNVYAQFLQTMKERDDYWHALPRQVARWWKTRAQGQSAEDPQELCAGEIVLTPDKIELH